MHTINFFNAPKPAPKKPAARYVAPRWLGLIELGKPRAFAATTWLPLTEDALYKIAAMKTNGETEMRIEQDARLLYRITQAQRDALRSDDRDTRRAAAREISNWLIRNVRN